MAKGRRNKKFTRKKKVDPIPTIPPEEKVGEGTGDEVAEQEEREEEVPPPTQGFRERKHMGQEGIGCTGIRKFEMEKRRKVVAELYLQGKHITEIAEIVGKTTTTVGHDLQQIRLGWKQIANVDFNEKREQELARIDNLEMHAWMAWERSQLSQSGVKVTETQVPTSEGEEEEVDEFESNSKKRKSSKGKVVGKAAKLVTIRNVTERSESTRVGDGQFLLMIARCIELRLKLLGLIQDKTTINNYNRNTATFDWSQFLARPSLEPEDDEINQEIERITAPKVVGSEINSNNPAVRNVEEIKEEAADNDETDDEHA